MGRPATAVYVCVPCALGNCTECRRQVTAGRVTKPCVCKHGPARRLARVADPRTVGPGTIVGGAPNEQGTALIDATHGIILDYSTVARIDNPSDGRTVVALCLEGRLNRSPDRSSILYLLNGDAAAALVTQLVGLAARMGPDFEAEFREALDQRMAAEDLWPPVVPAGGPDA